MLAAVTPVAKPFDCDAAVIIDRPVGACEDKLGRFINARRGPIVSGRPTLEVRFEPEWGTNLFVEHVALLRREGSAYRLLWKHPLIIATAGLPGVADEATVFSWRWVPKGRIEVLGKRTIGKVYAMQTGSASGSTTVMPNETYCYSLAAQTFAACPTAKR